MTPPDPLPLARGRSAERIVELVWLVPVILATIVAVLTARRLEVEAPLLAVALIPWVLHAIRRSIPAWLFGILAIGPVAAILALEGVNAGIFLGTTALCLLASRAGRVWQLAAVIVIALLLPFFSALSPLPFDPGSFYFAIGDLFGVAVGMLLGYSRRLALELRSADARLVALRAQEERTRLARDVHDLVAHSLTVVVLHIGGARRIIRSDPAGAERALEQAEQTSRDSLDGIRRVVGLLRSDDDVSTVPTDLSGLLESYRSAGVPLAVDVDEHANELPLFVRSLLHRVTREALANASRYRSAESVVAVVARVDSAGVGLVVTNEAPRQRTETTGGYGLVGLREQVESAGGTLTSAYREGRWRVECRIPVDAAIPVAGAASR